MKIVNIIMTRYTIGTSPTPIFYNNIALKQANNKLIDKKNTFNIGV